MSSWFQTLAAVLSWSILFSLTEGRLFRETPVILDYHNGPLLSGEAPIKVYLTFYGEFTRYDKATVRAFLDSFEGPGKSTPALSGIPTVSQWWSLTQGYTDMYGAAVSQKVRIVKEREDKSYSKGKSLKQSDISELVVKSVKEQIFPADPRAIYLVLTAQDVLVEGFCSVACGQHFFTYPSADTNSHMLPYAWVGNSATQCPGFCAWPFAKSELLERKDSPVLKAPNGIGVDGMVITLAKVLAGAATNPFGNAYYQGDQSVALEAAGACTGAFGPGAYAGNPGTVLIDKMTGASYNMKGYKRWKFMVPYMWNPATSACAGKR